MLSHLKIRDLELVVALHEEGSVTQAAKRVGSKYPPAEPGALRCEPLKAA
jgi:hypothetical protein